jgi:F0F1-type ATP synthase assembly protein I
MTQRLTETRGLTRTDWDPTTEPKRPDKTLGELFADMSADIGTLFRKEIELAKLEAKEEGKRLGRGAGMFGAAGLAGWLALLFVSLAAAWLLDQAMNTALAFLIVGVIWGIAAAALAMSGKKHITSAHALPTTTQTIKEDVQWARTLKN